jgi:hypothetical protein
MNASLSQLLIGSSLLVFLSGHVAIGGTEVDQQRVYSWSADILSSVHSAAGVSNPVSGCEAPAAAATTVDGKTDEERRNDMLRTLISKHQLTTGKVAAFNPARSLTPHCPGINRNEDS